MSAEAASSFVSIAADLHASMRSLTDATARALNTAKIQDRTIELLQGLVTAAEVERDEARAEQERLRTALNDTVDTLYSICRGCFGPVIVREIQPVLDRARAALSPSPPERQEPT